MRVLMVAIVVCAALRGDASLCLAETPVIVRPRSADPFRKAIPPPLEQSPSAAYRTKKMVLLMIDFHDVLFEAAVAAIEAKSREVDPTKKGIRVGSASPGRELRLTLSLRSVPAFDSGTASSPTATTSSPTATASSPTATASAMDLLMYSIQDVFRTEWHVVKAHFPHHVFFAPSGLLV